MIIIGGSGSTGSSLLQSILNRHSELVAGQETSIFIYPQLYRKWNRYKRFLIDKGPLGIKSTGWSVRNGMDLLHEDYGWQKDELQRAIMKTRNFSEFVEVFFEKPLTRKGASIWIEKTPQNACGFRHFLNTFSQGKVIQMLRDPYDTMASLIARGFEPYIAAGYFVYHTACAASVAPSARYLSLHYSDLVEQPEQVIRQVTEFIGVPFEPHMLIPSEEEVRNPLKLQGWNHSERDRVKKSSLGRFDKLAAVQQNEIIAALQVFQISTKHKRKYAIKFANFKEICGYFNYEYRALDVRPFLSSMKSSRSRDMLSRTLRLHPGNLFNYPGELVVH